MPADRLLTVSQPAICVTIFVTVPAPTGIIPVSVKINVTATLPVSDITASSSDTNL